MTEVGAVQVPHGAVATGLFALSIASAAVVTGAGTVQAREGAVATERALDSLKYIREASEYAGE